MADSGYGRMLAWARPTLLKAAACYLQARPESGYIWKPYKQKFAVKNKETIMEMNRGEIVGQLKSQSTLRLFLLTVITLAIYTAHYIKRQTTIINRHLDTEHQISEGFVNFLLILAYVTVILIVPYVLVEEGHPIVLISNLLDNVYGILVLIWAFKARNRMNMLLAVTKQQPHWFHGLWTFLFTALYFNFKINNLNEHFAEQGAALDGDSAPHHPSQ